MEIHGYTEFGSIDATIDGERITVPGDDPENRHRKMIADWEAAGNTIPAYAPPPEPPYQLYKSVFINRLDDEEAEGLEIVLGEAPAKLRMLFNSVEYFVSDDPLFLDLHQTIAAVLGPSRAAQLLEKQE